MAENTAAPTGNEAVQDSQESLAPVQNEPSVIELKEDSLVRLPGSDKPTKYGEWFKGYQGRYTEATQQRSALQRELKAHQEQLEQVRREAERYRTALELPSQPKENPLNKLLEKTTGLPYVKGEEVAQITQALMSELSGRDEKLQVRDQAIRLMANELMEMKKVLGQMYQRTAQTDFAAKMGKYREQLGLPEEAQEFLSELYSAYEGENLDEEFPEIAKRRWEQLNALVQSEQKRRVAEARKARFIPGKGGGVVPGKGGPIDTSQMNAKEAADVLFEQFVRPGEDS